MISRNKFIKNLFFCLLLMGAISCTHSVHIVNFSEFKPYVTEKSGKPIQAKAEQFVVLWFADNTSYVDEAYKKLANQCPQGNVTGIATQYYTSHGFMSWTNHIVMQGLCVN